MDSGRTCNYPGMDMTLRFEIFPRDLDAAVDFYVRVLGFRVSKDQRADREAYVALQRGSVRVGVLRRDVPGARADRRPPTGVELVLEVDDVAAERDWVVAAGWPLEEDLQHRRWGLTDFRICDPAGYYLRITSRAAP
jgi:lactoylglutathione lyase